jgi:hypothetical protein
MLEAESAIGNAVGFCVSNRLLTAQQHAAIAIVSPTPPRLFA